MPLLTLPCYAWTLNHDSSILEKTFIALGRHSYFTIQSRTPEVVCRRKKSKTRRTLHVTILVGNKQTICPMFGPFRTIQCDKWNKTWGTSFHASTTRYFCLTHRVLSSTDPDTLRCSENTSVCCSRRGQDLCDNSPCMCMSLWPPCWTCTARRENKRRTQTTTTSKHEVTSTDTEVWWLSRSPPHAGH